jgi:hypothetical protein
LITEIGPVVAPSGTVALITVDVTEGTSAARLLNNTVLVWLKFFPDMVMTLPAEPLNGLNALIVGIKRSSSFLQEEKESKTANPPNVNILIFIFKFYEHSLNLHLKIVTPIGDH